MIVALAEDHPVRFLIILEELFTNVVEFTAGHVSVTLAWRRRRLTIDFGGDGLPFDPLADPGPDLEAPADQRSVGGLGIAIGASPGRPSALPAESQFQSPSFSTASVTGWETHTARSSDIARGKHHLSKLTRRGEHYRSFASVYRSARRSSHWGVQA